MLIGTVRRAFLRVAACLAATFALSRVAPGQGVASLDDAIAGLSNPMRVLVIAAHPDDEDTQLITWLARGRHVETAYLSLTRGDGGQNLLGNELGEALGVIRTEELLAARRVDGGKQFFTRAYDFGFSKSADETFRHWPRDSILRDVVTVVRSFKPHVIVAMFSGTPRDGHGHHQASGILAREAYDIAGDTVRFPRSATEGLGGWTPLKFYRGAWSVPATDSTILRINVGEFNPMIGRSYAEIAAESRSQHKSQGFGSLQPKGARFTQIRRESTRVNGSVAPGTERSLFDGIDTTWARYKTPGVQPDVARAIDEIVAATRKAQAAPYLREPSSAVQPLWDAVAALYVLAAGNVVRFDSGARRPIRTGVSDDLRAAAVVAYRKATSALTIAAGVAVEATVPREQMAAADSAPLAITVYNRGRVAIRSNASTLVQCVHPKPLSSGGVRYDLPVSDSDATIVPDSSRTWRGFACTADERLNDGPYWLRNPRRGDTFATASVVESEKDATRGRAVNVPVWIGASAGDPVWIETPIVYRYGDPIRGDVSRPLAHVPEISVTLERAIEYAQARMPLVRQVRVEVRSAVTVARDVRISLQLPAGLRADSSARTVTLLGYGGVRSATFTVRGELPPGRHTIGVVAESNGKRYGSGYAAIEYEHIRPQRLYRDATLTIEAVDVKLPPDIVVAYIQGVGDNSAPMLQQLGLRVTTLNPADIPKTDLSRYNAIVVGTRAYESNDALVTNNAALLDYVKRGGTMVVQYGQYEMQRPGMMPYSITLGRPADRVTDETSPVRVLDPTARVLSYPNAITASDFAGWIQDRSLYMPRTHAPEYGAVISTNDLGEPPNDGGILVAKYGSGTYVYTSLAFFRQLPNGVPGAARLFVNLLAAKAPEKVVVP
jgi:LmbE family N-acetylglucosaminyl deacetylase